MRPDVLMVSRMTMNHRTATLSAAALAALLLVPRVLLSQEPDTAAVGQHALRIDSTRSDAVRSDTVYTLKGVTVNPIGAAGRTSPVTWSEIGADEIRARHTVEDIPDLRVKSYDHLNTSRASVVQLRTSLYVMRLIGPPSVKK